MRRSFAYEILLILCPVVLLCAMALFSIRQDRASVERDAQERADTLARLLARECGAALETALRECRNAWLARRTWRVLQLGAEPPPSKRDLESALADLEREVQAWQRQHPNLRLEQMAQLESAGAAGKSPTWVSGALAPSPPAWCAELTPDQWRLWHQAELTPASSLIEESFAAVEALLASELSPEARTNAMYLELRLRAGSTPDHALASEFASLARSAGGLYSSAGLPLALLALLETCRLSSAEQVKTLFDDWKAALPFQQPALLIERLLDEFERRSANPGALQPELDLLREELRSAARARELVALIPRASLEAELPSEVWLEHDRGRFLALCHPSDSTADHPASGVLLFPFEVVRQALDQAAGAAPRTLPDYFAAQFRLGSEVFPVGGHTPADGEREATNIVSRAVADFEVVHDAERTRHAFEVRLLLASPDMLYADYRRRAWASAALVLAAFAISLLGLGRAWRAYRQQVRLSAMKSNFVSSVSHELRAPIASVRLMAESLERGKIREPDRQQQYYQLISQECRRLSALIGNVLDFSRIEQGRKEYAFAPTNVAALVRQTVAVMAPSAAERGVQLELELDEATFAAGEPQPELDGEAVQQALVNLIDNAIQYAPAGSAVTVGAALQTGPAGPQLNLFVQDHGPGIPAAEQARIFEPFYRRGSELRRETRGIGIGLSLVQHVARGHGGQITVQSYLGQGSRFTLTLPVVQKPR